MASSTKEIEAQLAALSERCAFLELHSAPYQNHRAERERVERIERFRAIETLGAFDKLSPADQGAWLSSSAASTSRLTAMLRNAKPAARERMLGRLNADRRARFVFAMAPAPQLIRIKNPQGYRTGPTKITGAQQIELNAAGVETVARVKYSESDAGFGLPGWRMSDRDIVLDADAWDARLAIDEQLATLIASGEITATRLTDDEAREHALREYTLAWANRSEGLDGAGPQLPSLS